DEEAGSGMPATFFRSIRMGSPVDHRDDACRPRDHGKQSHLEVILLVDAQFLHDGRHPKTDGIESHGTAEVNSAQRPYPAILEGVHEAVPLSKMFLVGDVLLDSRQDQMFFVLREPL